MIYVQVEDFELSVRLECELRPYQREGIAWLAFLRRTGLHGCLADDMGLGKTLQATAIIAGQSLCRHDTPYAVDGSSAPAAALVVLLAAPWLPDLFLWTAVSRRDTIIPSFLCEEGIMGLWDYKT